MVITFCNEDISHTIEEEEKMDKMMANLKKSNVEFIHIPIGNLSSDSVNLMLSHALNLEPDATRDLTGVLMKKGREMHSLVGLT